MLLATSTTTGNRYFEFPHPLIPGSTRRVIDYREKREWSEYGYESLPVQWSAWMRRTRQDPPTLQELQQDISRRQRLQSNVQRLQQAYTEEKLALQAEAERVAQLNAPTTSNIKNKKQEEMENAPYPSQSNPSVVPTIVAETGHPPLQEFGANVPKAKPHEGVFPGMAEDSPERQTMAAALDDAADRTMGREEKERQIRQGRVEPVARPAPSKRYADAPATPVDSYFPKKQGQDDYKPDEWKPVSRRR